MDSVAHPGKLIGHALFGQQGSTRTHLTKDDNHGRCLAYHDHKHHSRFRIALLLRREPTDPQEE